MKKVLLLVFAFIGLTVYSQVYVPGDHNDWDLDNDNEATLKSNFGGTQVFYGITIQVTIDNQFKVVNGSYGTDWGAGYWITSYDQRWAPGYQGDNAIWKGTFQNYIHLCIEDPSDYTNNNLPIGIMTLSASPVKITSVSQAGTQKNSTFYTNTTQQTINITLSTAKSNEEKVYLRYTTNNWLTDNFVSANGSGTSYSAYIPAQSNGTEVQYYVLTTTLIHSNGNDLDNYPDLMTINYNNNSGDLYKYTTSNPRSKTTGNWNSTSTWLFDVVPTNNDVIISANDNVNLDDDASINSLTIETDATFTASDGAKAARTLTISDGGTLTNNGTFTASDGTVVFAGTGTVDGSSTTTFNDLSGINNAVSINTNTIVNGTLSMDDVDVSASFNPGTSSIIDGTLTLNSGGSINTNSPSFGTDATLVYNQGGDLAPSLEWPDSNSPTNIEIKNSTNLSLTSSKSISGNLTVTNGSLKSTGGNSITMNGTNQIITISNETGGAINGTDNGYGNDLSLVISDGSTTTLTGDATTDNDNEKKFYNVTVDAGGTLALSRGILCKYGTFTVNGTLQINENGYVQSVPDNSIPASYSSGKLLYNNGGDYTSTDYEWPTTNAPTNLIIQNSGTNVTLNNAKSIAGNVTVETGTTLTSSGNLTLLSDATGTASLISNGTVSGNVTVERFVDEAAKAATWHYVSSPVSGQSITSTWMTDNSVVFNDPAWHCYRWDEDTQYWIYFDYVGSQPEDFDDDVFVEGRGYSISRSETGDLSFTGTVRTSDVTYLASYTPNAGAGWNLVGNPFTSPIGVTNDASSMEKFLNINSDANSGKINSSYLALYIWDEQSGYAYGENDYKVISNGTIDGYTKINQNYIESGQAFMVKVSSGGDLKFNKNMQYHADVDFYKSKEYWPSVELLVQGQGVANTTAIGFHDEMTAGLDPSFDVGKLKGNPDIALYTRLVEDNGVDFAIQALSIDELETYEIPVGLDISTPGVYEFSANRTNFDHYNIVLEDREENTFTNLRWDTYFAQVDEGGLGRFYLHFKDATGVEETVAVNKPLLHLQNNQLQIKNLEAGDYRIRITDITGRTVMVEEFSAGQSISVPVSLKTGIYIVEIISENHIFANKLYIQ